MNNSSTKNLVLTAILTAIVVILQLLGSFIKMGPFSISLVLVPIVVGAATCGIGAAAWLGLVFSVVVLLSGDAAAFLAVNVPGTIITVILKGIACGLAAGAVYRLFEKKNILVAVMCAAIAAPVVNTGIFVLGCYTFFIDTISSWASSANFTRNAFEYMIFVMIGANFLFELAVNMILSPVIVRLLKIKENN